MSLKVALATEPRPRATPEDEARFVHLQETDEALAAVIQRVSAAEQRLESRVAALETEAAQHAGPTWATWLARLSSRRFQAFLAALLTAVGAMAAGSVSVHDGVAAIVAAVVAWLASETATDISRAGKSGKPKR